MIHLDRAVGVERGVAMCERAIGSKQVISKLEKHIILIQAAPWPVSFGNFQPLGTIGESHVRTMMMQDVTREDCHVFPLVMRCAMEQLPEDHFFSQVRGAAPEFRVRPVRLRDKPVGGNQERRSPTHSHIVVRDPSRGICSRVHTAISDRMFFH